MKPIKITFLILAVIITVEALAQSPKITLDISNTSQFKSNGGVSIREDHVIFDGKSGILEFNSPYQPEGSFSISLWIKPNAEKRVQTLIMKGELCPDGNPNYKGFTFLFGITSDLKLAGTLASGEGNQFTGTMSFQSHSMLTPDIWQHLTAIYDADSVIWKVFIHGQETSIDQSFQPSREFFRKIAPSPTAPWIVGVKESYCDYVHGFDEYFNGSLKRIAIYDYKLSPDEIASESHVERNKNLFIRGGSALLLLLGFLIWRLLKKTKQ